MDRSRVTVAEIFRPRGIRGELIARSLTDVARRLESLTEAHVSLLNGLDLPVSLERAWQHKDDWVLKFAGVDSMAAADKFRGADLWVPVTQRASLPDGDYFQSDLIGCQLVDRDTGRSIGVVQGWQQYGGPPLMELTVIRSDGSGREALIPFVSSECQVDLGARVIRASLPEGILEL